MGCGVACVASLLGISYKKALKLFESPKNACFKGYYCKDLCKALKNSEQNYSFKKYKINMNHFLKKERTIVFIERNSKYPEGHYLTKTQKGWMNPWINFPIIAPAKAGFSKNLPGKITWIIFKNDI